MDEPSSWWTVAKDIAPFLALAVSLLALWFTRRSANAARDSAQASSSSAATAEKTLAFNREQRVARAVRHIVTDWKTHQGSQLRSVLIREQLPADEEAEVIRRVKELKPQEDIPRLLEG